MADRYNTRQETVADSISSIVSGVLGFYQQKRDMDFRERAHADEMRQRMQDRLLATQRYWLDERNAQTAQWAKNNEIVKESLELARRDDEMADMAIADARRNLVMENFKVSEDKNAVLFLDEKGEVHYNPYASRANDDINEDAQLYQLWDSSRELKKEYGNFLNFVLGTSDDYSAVLNGLGSGGKMSDAALLDYYYVDNSGKKHFLHHLKGRTDLTPSDREEVYKAILYSKVVPRSLEQDVEKHFKNMTKGDVSREAFWEHVKRRVKTSTGSMVAIFGREEAYADWLASAEATPQESAVHALTTYYKDRHDTAVEVLNTKRNAPMLKAMDTIATRQIESFKTSSTLINLEAEQRATHAAYVESMKQRGKPNPVVVNGVYVGTKAAFIKTYSTAYYLGLSDTERQSLIVSGIIPTTNIDVKGLESSPLVKKGPPLRTPGEEGRETTSSDIPSFSSAERDSIGKLQKLNEMARSSSIELVEPEDSVKVTAADVKAALGKAGLGGAESPEEKRARVMGLMSKWMDVSELYVGKQYADVGADGVYTGEAIGYGRNLTKNPLTRRQKAELKRLDPDAEWNELGPVTMSEAAAAWLRDDDLQQRYARGEANFSNWNDLGVGQQASLLDWFLNSGVKGTVSVPGLVEAIESGNFDAAADILESNKKLIKRVGPKRVKDRAYMLRNDEIPEW